VDEEFKDEVGRTWYLPHHGIYHPQKSKVRVLVDCSATFEGHSLNDKLLQGPDLTNNLLGVLTRFRQEQHAFMADMEKMFFQGRVRKEDQIFVVAKWRLGAESRRLLYDRAPVRCSIIPCMC